MRRAACLLVVVISACSAEGLSARSRIASRDEIRGAAMAHDGRLFTWGVALKVYDRTLGKHRVLAAGRFGEGGCLVDIDGDGQEEFVGKEGANLGPLTWRKAPDWKPVVLEPQTDTHNCIEATLFGRKGVLAIHRHSQVRFYEPRGAKEAWSVREIYSIYTPSRQAGLSLYDIDRDGRMDILCGNYWIQSPERFDLPWHIFAINTWFELPQSAMHAHALAGDGLFVAQAHMAPARIAVFRMPEDARQLWKESRIPGDYRRVHAVQVVDGRIVFGENNGRSSRIFEVREGTAVQIARGVPCLKLFARPGGLLSVGPREIVSLRWMR